MDPSQTASQLNTSFPEMLTWHGSSSSEKRSTAISSSAAFLNTISTMLLQTVSPVLLVCGSFGNVMTVIVMQGMRRSKSTACLSLYFTALAVSDQCLLLTSILWFWVDAVFTWPPSFFHHNLLCTVPFFLWYTSSLTSAWFLVVMTYQRVTSVVTPHRVGVLCTVRRGKVIIAAIMTTACVLNLHFLATFVYRPESRQCLPRQMYESFIYLFTWLDLFWASGIPFVLLVIGNCVLTAQVIRSVQLSRSLRGSVDQQTTRGVDKVYPMTVTLILTSSAFLVLTLPICLFDAYRRTISTEDADADFSAKINLTRTVTLLLWSATSASNFYLYLLSGSKFRQETKRYLCWPHADHAKVGKINKSFVSTQNVPKEI